MLRVVTAQSDHVMLRVVTAQSDPEYVITAYFDRTKPCT